MKNVAIDAYRGRCLRVALSVEGLPAYAAERTGVRPGKDGSCIGVAEASVQVDIGAAWLSVDVRGDSQEQKGKERKNCSCLCYEVFHCLSPFFTAVWPCGRRVRLGAQVLKYDWVMARYCTRTYA